LPPRTEDCEYNMCLNSNNILKNTMIDLINGLKRIQCPESHRGYQVYPKPHG